MRAFVTIIILALLSGCANYNQPMYDDGQGVYYEDPGAVYSVTSSASFAYAAAYPWWSMDYFYLGHHPWRPWPHAYYSPYFYPYYFSVLYPPWHWHSHYWHGGYYAWRDPYWHHRYRRYRRTSHGGYYGGDADYGGRIPGNVSAPPTDTRENQRRVAVTPSGQYGGMTVVSPEARKEKPSRVSPTTPSGITAVVNPSPAATTGTYRPASSQSVTVTPAKPRRQSTLPEKSTSWSKQRPPAHSAKSHPAPTLPSSPSTGRSSLSIPATRASADPNKHDRNQP
jgi:hypothetical protein